MKKYNIVVNGASYEVEVEELSSEGAVKSAPAAKAPVSKPAKKVSKPAPAAAKPKKAAPSGGGSVIEAPMPGTILSIEVKQGDSVSEGDVILVLEAMKMENEIKSAVSGTVKSVDTTVGASVNPGEVLVVIE